MSEKLPLITLDKARGMVEAAIVGKESFVYTPNSSFDGCAYVHTGKELWNPELERYDRALPHEPGCLIGKALIDYGVPMEKFLELQVNTGMSASGAIDALVKDGVMEQPERAAMQYFDDVQENQDARHEWGASVAMANEGHFRPEGE